MRYVTDATICVPDLFSTADERRSCRRVPEKRETPGGCPSGGSGLHQIKSLAVTYFHIDIVDTSIGAGRFHFRVRKGIGWFPLAMAARQTNRSRGESCLAAGTNSDKLLPNFDLHVRTNRLGVIWSSLTGN